YVSFFFFSSRRRHTISKRDWSSDVCSSDLLYGKSRKPTKEMLDSVDVIIFDLQDIGSRYYTFIYTMAYVMEACMENEKHFVVLDRPNPISGNSVEGNLVEDDVRSFVGL